MTRKTKVTAEKAERLRQFEVVCKVALQLGRGATRGGTQAGLYRIGREEFGLVNNEINCGLGRAQNFLYAVNEATRARNARELKRKPTPFIVRDERLAA